MIFLNIIASLIFIALITLYALIITNIVDFQIDHINPLDISATLEKYVKILKYLHVLIVAIFLFDIYHFWPPMILNIIITWYFYSKTKGKSYFEALTIVRDSNTHKYVFMGLLSFEILAFIYQLIMMIILVFT